MENETIMVASLKKNMSGMNALPINQITQKCHLNLTDF